MGRVPLQPLFVLGLVLIVVGSSAEFVQTDELLEFSAPASVSALFSSTSKNNSMMSGLEMGDAKAMFAKLAKGFPTRNVESEVPLANDIPLLPDRPGTP